MNIHKSYIREVLQIMYTGYDDDDDELSFESALFYLDNSLQKALTIQESSR